MVLSLLLVAVLAVTADGRPAEECCDTKLVGDILYTLTGQMDTEAYKCLNDCIYQKEGERGMRYCFAMGDQKVECQDEEGKPTPPAGGGGEGIPTRPAGEERPTPPAGGGGEGRPTRPAGEGRPTRPAGEGRPTPPAGGGGEGRPTRPAGEGRPTPPAEGGGEGRPTPPAGGGATPPAGGGATEGSVVDPANIQSNPSLAGAIYTTGLSIYYSSGIESTISDLAQALNRSEDGISTTFAEIETFYLSISQNNETVYVSEDNLLIQYLFFLIFSPLPPNETIFNATVDSIISTGNLTIFDQTVSVNYTNQESLIIQGEIAKSAGKFWKEKGDIVAPFQGPTPGNITSPWSWPLWPLFTASVVLGAEAGFLVGGPVDAILHSIGYTIVFLPIFVEEGFMKRTYSGNLTQHSALSAIIHSNSGLDLDISGRIHFGNLTSFNFYN